MMAKTLSSNTFTMINWSFCVSRQVLYYTLVRPKITEDIFLFSLVVDVIEKFDFTNGANKTH